MHVLLCNDDGISAQGIKTLARAFRDGGYRVTVVAPDHERSCASHALTMHQPLYVSQAENWLEGTCAFQASGTPADCSRLGIQVLADEKVDMVVSGINHGGNTGSDTLYSGTVAAAMEAALLGVKAMAVSLVSGGDWDFAPAARLAVKVAGDILEGKLPPCPVYNLNVPPVPEDQIKGLKMADLARRRYLGSYEKRISPFGREYYWMNTRLDKNSIQQDTDAALTRQGWATLTPLGWQLTQQDVLSQLITGEE